MVSSRPSSHENSIPNFENTHHLICTPPSPTDIPLIALNISAQINENSHHQPSSMVDSSTTNPHKTLWIRQDKLILGVILVSTTSTITPFVSAQTSQQHDKIAYHEKPLAFEELHDLLIGHDAYLRRLETTTQQLVASANYSNRRPASSSAANTLKVTSKWVWLKWGSSRQDSN
ncbi:hypothetical protein AAG906_003397 [Vitis piasezkii]